MKSPKAVFQQTRLPSEVKHWQKWKIVQYEVRRMAGDANTYRPHPVVTLNSFDQFPNDFAPLVTSEGTVI